MIRLDYVEDRLAAIGTSNSSSTARRTTRNIGETSQGRDIRVVFVGGVKVCNTTSSHRTRVLVIAGQHGDEPVSRQAVQLLLESPAFKTFAELFQQQLEFAFIIDANPDGAAANTRTNAAGIDLNRDHQLLVSKETQAIHKFARQWAPDLVIDVHTFPPRRKLMIAQGITYRQNVQLDVSNSLSIAPAIRETSEKLLNFLLAELRAKRVLVERYLLFRKNGIIRHSTPDVVDARNGLALRMGVPSLLIEGRQPGRRDPKNQSAKTIQAVTQSLMLSFVWSLKFGKELKRLKDRQLRTGDQVAIRSKLQTDDNAQRVFMFADPTTGAAKRRKLSSSFRPKVSPTESVTLPVAYAIPKQRIDWIAILNRHGFQTVEITFGHGVESFELLDPGASLDPVDSKKNGSRWCDQKDVRCSPETFAVYPVDQPGGAALAAFLEPRAKYGLARTRAEMSRIQLLRLIDDPEAAVGGHRI